MSDPKKPPEKAHQFAGDGLVAVHHMDAFNYIFANPNWLSNVLLVMVCQLFIPIVGPIVVLGYQFEIVELMYRKRQSIYPDFEFGRFADYLKRGVWPFLVSLIVAACSIPIIVAAYLIFIAIVVGGSAIGDEVGAIFAIVGIVVFVVFMILISIFLQVAFVPIVLRAGLSQDFGEAFNWAWIKHYIRSMWKETIISMLFMMVMGFVAMIAGMALFCIGIYPAVAVLMLARAQLYYQLYRVFVSRGGSPIPMKDDDTVFAEII